MHFPRHERRIFAAASTLIILSAILYCSWPLGFPLNPKAMQDGLASELGAFGQPYNWVFIWGDIVSGVLLLAAVMLLLRARKPTRWAWLALIFLAIYGVCGALDAALPMHCLPSEQVCGPVLHDPMLILHGAIDFIGSTTLVGTLVAAAIFVRKHNRQWQSWIYVIGAGGTAFALASGAFYVWGGPGYWAQRYYISLSCIWVASMPFVLRPKTAAAKVIRE